LPRLPTERARYQLVADVRVQRVYKIRNGWFEFLDNPDETVYGKRNYVPGIPARPQDGFAFGFLGARALSMESVSA